MIQFNTHLKGKVYTIKADETEAIKMFLKDFDNITIPHYEWQKFKQKNNIKSEIA